MKNSLLSKSLLVGALALLPCMVHAENRLPSKAYSACMDHAAGVTAAMLDCIANETKEQDALLNARYVQLMKRLAPPRKAAMLAAQRAWINYRYYNCRFYLDPDGGTIAGVNATSCAMQMTIDRAAELGELSESGT